LTVTTWHFLTVAIPISAGMWRVFNTVFITADVVFPYKKRMSFFKGLVAGLSERRLEFDSGSVQVGFFVESGQAFSGYCSLPLFASFHECPIHLFHSSSQMPFTFSDWKLR
jgi:hypothetical protein